MNTVNDIYSVINNKELANWDKTRCESTLKKIDKESFAMAMAKSAYKLTKPHMKSAMRRNIAKIKFQMSQIERKEGAQQ